MPFTMSIPDTKPWVRAEWDAAGAMFAVSCQRCGGMDYAFVPYLRENPDAPADWVRVHNHCPERLEARP